MFRPSLQDSKVASCSVCFGGTGCYDGYSGRKLGSCSGCFSGSGCFDGYSGSKIGSCSSCHNGCFVAVAAMMVKVVAK
jgi:hypothetical protein